ncbi:PREDICTED: uncharacterized protein LOC104709415 [Camelina sativa]|uniref:Uncharacterized protein LOC104709415 n=1 Tax=Camelina sativa TaxID=90675 RepID=A0ABM0TCS2_CAMSA|nr:PREDICTED: uncharacterized protein LOC104709415 [Camelina sativa]
MKAWYAKEAAVRNSRGTDEESYKLLATYMYLLERGNPGTVYKLEHTYAQDGSKKFKYLFFALGASIAGIKHCRKVILVDGTTIKSKFKGVLIAASMQDANFQVYPIAFGVVDSENELAWTWYFRKLSLLVPDAADLVIVFDRHRAIYSGIAQAKAYQHFKDSFDEIVARSTRCIEYLNGIPLPHWTQAFCTAKRYNIMSSNVAEALNSAIAKIVELPIVTMVESIMTKLMQWFCIRRAKAKKMLTLPKPICPNVNKLMLRKLVESAGLAKLLIPCSHALAAARVNGVYVPSLVGKMYHVTVFGDTYAELIYHVPNQGDEDVPVIVLENEFNPPTNPPGPGRRRKRRISSTGEHVGNKRKRTAAHKCSTCGQPDHNRATCKNVIG